MKSLAIFFGVLVICLCTVTGAEAAITVNWQWDQNAAQPVVDTLLNPLDYTPTAATVQLIYSPVAAASMADATVGDGNPYTPDGAGEVLLDQSVVQNPGGFWIHNKSVSIPGPGFVYQRVFDDASNPGGATKGDYYGNGTVFTAVIDPGGPFNSYLWNSSTEGGVGGAGAPGQYIVGVEIIPEPGSMALFGLGALVVVIRRRFRR